MAKFRIPPGAGAWLDRFDGGQLKGAGAIVTLPDSWEGAKSHINLNWEPAIDPKTGEPDSAAVALLKQARESHPGWVKKETERLESEAKAQEELNANKVRLAKAKLASAPAAPEAPPPPAAPPEGGTETSPPSTQQ